MSKPPKYYKEEPSIDDLDVDDVGDEEFPMKMRLELMSTRANFNLWRGRQK